MLNCNFISSFLKQKPCQTNIGEGGVGMRGLKLPKCEKQLYSGRNLLEIGQNVDKQ